MAQGGHRDRNGDRYYLLGMALRIDCAAMVVVED